MIAFIFSLLFLTIIAPTRHGLFAKADTPSCSITTGQNLIDSGSYLLAVAEFTCYLKTNPKSCDGFRGRAEAYLMLNLFAHAQTDYNNITANATTLTPTCIEDIKVNAQYRALENPSNPAPRITYSFANWVTFDYDLALEVLQPMLAANSKDVTVNALIGSTRVLSGVDVYKGRVNLNYASAKLPFSGDIDWLMADAQLYGLGQCNLAFHYASAALGKGINIPRIHAILSTCYSAWGMDDDAADELDIIFNMVTVETVNLGDLPINSEISSSLVPGRTIEVALVVAEYNVVSVNVNAPDCTSDDTILIVYDSNGIPVLSNDDFVGFCSGFAFWQPPAGIYTIKITSFDGVGTFDVTISSVYS